MEEKWRPITGYENVYEVSNSEETRRKLSEAAKGRVNPMQGKHHSEETKRKISEAKRRCNYVS